MAKKYNTHRISKRKTYTVNEIAALFDIHTKTIHLWSTQGLRAVEGSFPHLIPGEELARFLDERQNKRKCKLAVDELYCVKCQQARKGLPDTIDIIVTQKRMGGGKTFIIKKARCEICGGKMNRFDAQATRAVVELLGTEVSLTNVDIKQAKV